MGRLLGIPQGEQPNVLYNYFVEDLGLGCWLIWHSIHVGDNTFFGMQILEEVIKYRWGALPDEQRTGIRNYVSNLIIKLSMDEVVFRKEKVFLNKLNVILVQVIHHSVPPTFPLGRK